MSYENDSSLKGEFLCTAKTLKSSRFCPGESKGTNKPQQLDSQKPSNMNHKQKPTRIRSLMDVRGRSLRRLLTEICKTRMFRTVGSVEGIGYQEPVKVSSKESMDNQLKVQYDDEKLRFKL